MSNHPDRLLAPALEKRVRLPSLYRWFLSAVVCSLALTSVMPAHSQDTAPPAEPQRRALIGAIEESLADEPSSPDWLIPPSGQGIIENHLTPFCSTLLHIPFIGTDTTAISASPATTASLGRPIEGTCAMPLQPKCEVQWQNVGKVVFGQLSFGELWKCGDEARLSGSVVVMPATVTTGTPADALMIGGAVVTGVAAATWTEFLIQNNNGAHPDLALPAESLHSAQDWVTGQLVHPATIGEQPIFVEQLYETEASAYGVNGPYFGTLRWFKKESEVSGPVTLLPQYPDSPNAATVLTGQLLVKPGTVNQIKIQGFEIVTGNVEGGIKYSSLYEAIRAVFATQVIMPAPVPQAPEVDHVANHNRPQEQPKKVAFWRVIYKNWFDHHLGLGGKPPNWCGIRTADGAIAVVYYKAAKVLKPVVESAGQIVQGGGFLWGGGLILQLNPAEGSSTVVTEVRPSDGNDEGNSRPKGSTFDPFEDFPCPPPFVPATL